MAFLIDDDTGEITLIQGDSGTLVLEGIPTDKNYKVFFSFYNEDGNILGDEAYTYSNYLSTVSLSIPASLTDLLTVDGGIDDTAIYYYGVKICYEDTGYEDTLLIGSSTIGDLNSVTVYPKKVEGI